jgi:hypothetical protein
MIVLVSEGSAGEVGRSVGAGGRGHGRCSRGAQYGRFQESLKDCSHTILSASNRQPRRLTKSYVCSVPQSTEQEE